MTLRFVLCAFCEKHGRFIGEPGRVPIEVVSKRAGLVHVDRAASHLVIGQEAMFRLMRQIASSGLADVDTAEELDPSEENAVCADPFLREKVERWNLAAHATNDPERFAQSAFPCPSRDAANLLPRAVA